MGDRAITFRTRIFYIADTMLVAGYSRTYEPQAKDYRYVATITASSPDDAFAQMNRGSGNESQALTGQRSLSVGDIVYMEDFFYLCQGSGWRKLYPGKETTELYRMALRAEDDPPVRCPVCGGPNPGDATHTRCTSTGLEGLG